MKDGLFDKGFGGKLKVVGLLAVGLGMFMAAGGLMASTLGCSFVTGVFGSLKILGTMALLVLGGMFVAMAASSR